MSYFRLSSPPVFALFCTTSLIGATPSVDPSSEYMLAGKQSYETVCFGCHQPNGKGIRGAFPPLAGSPWVGGDPARMAKIVLHGLSGTISLEGQAYHAEMPPQGPLLDDTKVAQVLTYVRNSWGNSAPAVSPDAITALRAKYEGRTEYWDADALLNEHPLEDSTEGKTAPHALSELTYKVYQLEEKTNRLPRFGKLKPVAKGNATENRPSLSARGDVKGSFALVFEGKITTKERGEYTFHLESDDGSELYIDGKRIIDNDGIHAAQSKTGKILLSAGTYPFRLAYFNAAGQMKLALAWEGETFGLTTLSEDSAEKAGRGTPRIMLAADGRRARIFRNFIEGGTARAIGVGYPGAINLAWDANALRPALVWRGPFIDAGRHWTGRGQGFQPPANPNFVTLSPGPQFAALESGNSPWPETEARESSKLRTSDSVFRGYKLDSDGWPTFHYAVGEINIADRIAPVLNADLPVDQQATDSLIRTLSITGKGAGLTHRIARGDIEEMGGRTYVVDGKLRITLAEGSGRPVLRTNSGASELLVHAKPGTVIETSLTLLQ